MKSAAKREQDQKLDFDVKSIALILARKVEIVDFEKINE